MKLWIARDKNGDLYLFRDEPIKREDDWVVNCCWECPQKRIYLGYDEYPEITYENSPQQVELKLIEE